MNACMPILLLVLSVLTLAAENPALTGADIEMLLSVKIADDVIVARAKASGKPVELSAGDLAQLRKAGASEDLIRQLTSIGTTTAGAGIGSSPKQPPPVLTKAEALARNKALNESFSAGQTALIARKYEEAVKNLRTAAELDGGQSVIWNSLGDAYAGLARSNKKTAREHYRQCFDAYKKAIELKPNDGGYYNNYALALEADSRWVEAIEMLEKAADVDPAKAAMYNQNIQVIKARNK